MNLPRWLFVSLLSASVIAVFGFGAWWWITWPERTAQEFVRRLAAGDQSWKEMLHADADPSLVLRIMELLPPKDRSDVVSQPRSLGDVVFCRHSFKTSGDLGWEFTAERGTVIDASLDARANLLLAVKAAEFARLRALEEQAVARIKLKRQQMAEKNQVSK
jgi:hypothetical protein